MAREFKRTDRVGAQLQRELAGMMHEELKDPELGMVTIQEVRVVRDLSQAKVFYTSLDTRLSTAESSRRLNRLAGHLRWLLGQQLELRSVPRLLFVYDESIEQGERMDALIEQAVAHQGPADAEEPKP